jgi:membrane-associated protease RseP (regulator of RpoE activity)
MDDPFGQAVWLVWELPKPYRVILLVFLGSWAGLLVHELAHAFVARALGVRLWSVTLGYGPKLFNREIGGCRVQVGVLPLQGAVSLHDDDARALGYVNVDRPDWTFNWREGSSWRAPMISAAGAVSNFMAAAGINLYWYVMPQLSQPMFGLFLVCCMVNVLMFLNLAPIRGLDGWRMIVQAGAWRRRASPK